MFEKLTSFTKKVADLADKPTLSATQLKAQFDAAPDEVRQFLNKLIDALKSTTAGDSGAKNIGATAIPGVTGNDVQTILQALIPFAALGLGSNGFIATDTDWNTITKTGFYKGAANNPRGNNATTFIGVHIAFGEGYALQIAGRTNEFYMRNMENGVLFSWRRLIDDDYPVWSNLPLLNGAVVKQQPQYTRIGSLVMLRGMISCPAGTIFATLPADLRPKNPTVFKTALNTTIAGADATIAVYDNGNLLLSAVTHSNDIWLNGITYTRDFFG